MRPPRWTAAEDELLSVLWPLEEPEDVAAYVSLLGNQRTTGATCSRAQRLGLTRGHRRDRRDKGKAKVWTPEVVSWFREFARDHLWDEISAECERLWGFAPTRSAVQNARRKFGAPCSITDAGRFKPGNVPMNKGRTWDDYLTPEQQRRCRRTCFSKGELHGAALHRSHGLLGERDTKDGYREIRVDPRGARHTMERWIPLGAFNWMQANGREWPDGCKCVHADRDKTNDAADNIVPIPHDIWPLVNGANPSALPWHDRATLEAAIVSARISMRRSELARERRRIEGRTWSADKRYSAH